MSKKCIVVDLDETLIRQNTFHLWVKFIVSEFSLKRFVSISKLFFLISLRLIRAIKHEKLKKEILILSSTHNNKLNVDKFISMIEIFANNDILKKLEKKETGQVWILATAAPAIYSEVIAKKLNFDYCVSTPILVDDNWKENIREVKFQNVQALIEKLELTSIDELYTDHYDDIPLMRVSKKTFLVNPSLKTLEKVRETKINYDILD